MANYNYNDCIIFLLAKAYQKAHGHFRNRMFTYGLTPIQYLILEALWEEEGLSAKTIGEKLVLDGATLSGVLDRMEESGWIIKKTDLEHRPGWDKLATSRAHVFRRDL